MVCRAAKAEGVSLLQRSRLPGVGYKSLHRWTRARTTTSVALRPVEMGDQAEESEEVTVVERGFVLIKHRRKKHRCKCNACVKTAPGPPKVRPGSRYSPEFAVEMATSKYLDHRVPRRHAQQSRDRRSKPCCMEDEGWSLGIGVQAQVPNRLELLGSRARVVSVEGKGAARPHQVRSKKTNGGEPLMTCREVLLDVETGQGDRPGMRPE